VGLRAWSVLGSSSLVPLRRGRDQI